MTEVKREKVVHRRKDKSVCIDCSAPCWEESTRCTSCNSKSYWKSPKRSLLEKIVVDEKSGCWNFSGQINMYGYGVISSNLNRVRTRHYAHRVSYETHKGKIPKGLTIDHLCLNKRCVNPDHLEAVTNSENVRRANLVLGSPRQRKARRRAAAPCATTSSEIVAARKDK